MVGSRSVKADYPVGELFFSEFFKMLIVVTTMSISSSDFVTVIVIRRRDRKTPMYTKAPHTLPMKLKV